jgi:hypothetical protein
LKTPRFLGKKLQNPGVFVKNRKNSKVQSFVT